jgi:hypothetical protein
MAYCVIPADGGLIRTLSCYLWPLTRAQGHTREKEKRERERRELRCVQLLCFKNAASFMLRRDHLTRLRRLLVGKNMERISSLESLTVTMYKEVSPRTCS